MSDIKMSDERRKEIMAKLLEAQKSFAERLLRDYLEIYMPFVEDVEDKDKREAIKYCSYCGKKIEMPYNKANESCNESWRCPKCGKYHFYDYKECQYCGKRIEGK